MHCTHLSALGDPPPKCIIREGGSDNAKVLNGLYFVAAELPGALARTILHGWARSSCLTLFFSLFWKTSRCARKSMASGAGVGGAEPTSVKEWNEMDLLEQTFRSDWNGAFFVLCNGPLLGPDRTGPDRTGTDRTGPDRLQHGTEWTVFMQNPS